VVASFIGSVRKVGDLTISSILGSPAKVGGEISKILSL